MFPETRCRFGLPVAILLVVCLSLAACDGAERKGPALAPELQIDLTRHERLREPFGELERWLYETLSTSPELLGYLSDAAERLVHDAAKMAEAETDGPSLLVIQELEQFHRSTVQALVVWSPDRTLVELRSDWEKLRRRCFRPDAIFRESSPGLDELQRVREPAHEDNLLERLTFMEQQFRRLQEFAAEIEATPSADKTASWANTHYHGVVGPWVEEINEQFREKPPLALPGNGPSAVRRGWKELDRARDDLFSSLSSHRPDMVILVARHRAPNHVRGLQKLRREVEELSGLTGPAFEEVTIVERPTARVLVPEMLLRSDGKQVNVAAYSPDGGRIVTGSRDGTTRIWQADGSDEPVVLAGHLRDVRSAAFSPSGMHVVTASDDTSARVWNAFFAEEPVTLRGGRAPVRVASFSPDGKRIVTASWDGLVLVWPADGTGEPIRLEGHRNQVMTAVFSPDGRRVLTASWDGTARVFSPDGSGKPVVLEGHAGKVVSAAFSPDGQRVVTASDDGTARIWDADGSGAPVRLEGHERAVTDAAFSPDGSRVVTGSKDRRARIWNSDGSGEPVLLRGHEDDVVSAFFSPDGARVITVSWDRTVRIWGIDGAELFRLEGHPNNLTSAALSPDGSRVVTTCSDGVTRVFRLDRAERT